MQAETDIVEIKKFWSSMAILLWFIALEMEVKDLNPVNF